MLQLKRFGMFNRPLGLPWIGFERSTVWIGLLKYLDRWIVYDGLGTLRLHRFWRGDDDRASHTHPWWFITFPLCGYMERTFDKGVPTGTRYVAPFRFHFRPANFEHIVLYGVRPRAMFGIVLHEIVRKPFWTLVITGNKTNAWGFYPKPGVFIPWREYK